MIHRTLSALLACATLLWSAGASPTARFIIPADENHAVASWTGEAITLEGDTVKGKISSITIMTTLITKVNIKDEAKIKHTFTPENMKSFKIPLNKLVQGQLFVESIILEKGASPDQLEVFKRTHAEWVQIAKPGSTEKFYMLQLLNPHFQQVIKVYQSPEFVTKSYGLGNGLSVEARALSKLDNEYMIMKGDLTVEISERSYADTYFAQIFGDCPAMIKKYPSEKERVWNDLPNHIYEYTQLMSNK